MRYVEFMEMIMNLQEVDVKEAYEFCCEFLKECPNYGRGLI